MENKINETKQNMDNSFIVKKGEVYWCYLGTNIGSEQNGSGPDKVRPVLIIQIFSNKFFLIAPLTSKKHIGDWYIKISFKDSYVTLNQIKPVDVKRLIKSIGQISELELENIINKYIDLIKHKKH